MNWNAAPGFVIVKLELEKSSPVFELVTGPGKSGMMTELTPTPKVK